MLPNIYEIDDVRSIFKFGILVMNWKTLKKKTFRRHRNLLSTMSCAFRGCPTSTCKSDIVIMHQFSSMHIPKKKSSDQFQKAVLGPSWQK